MAWIVERKSAGDVVLYRVCWRDPATRKILTRVLGDVPREAAVEAARDVGARLERRPGSPGLLPARSVLARFLASRRALQRSSGTLRYYRGVLGRLFDELAVHGAPAKWTRAHVQAVLAAHRGWSGRTVQMHLVALRTVAKWARESHVAFPDVAAGLKGPKVITPESKAYSAREVDRLLAAAVGRPVEPAVALALLAGLSLGDLHAVRVEEIRGGAIRRLRQKSSVALAIPVSKRLRAILRRTVGKRKAGLVCDRLPRDERAAARMLERVQRAAGVDVRGWHALRHTFGTMLGLAKPPVPLATIRFLMGHRPGSTQTLKYLHPDAASAKAAVEQVGR